MWTRSWPLAASWPVMKPFGSGASKFGQAVAHLTQRRLPKPGNKWHLDEGVLTIARVETVALARCGSGRDRARHPCPEPARPGGRQAPAPEAAAKREVMRGVEHRQHKGLNNRTENSHPPIRRRERQISGSSQPARLDASFPPTVGSTTFSTSAAITFLPTSIGPPAPKPSRSGPRSPASPLKHGHQPARSVVPLFAASTPGQTGRRARTRHAGARTSCRSPA